MMLKSKDAIRIVPCFALSQTGKKSRKRKETNMEFLSGVTEKETLELEEILQPERIGTQVKVLQFLLNQIGCNAGTIDGSFGKNTLNALKSFQKKKGLVVDGVCGAKTWEALLT